MASAEHRGSLRGGARHRARTIDPAKYRLLLDLSRKVRKTLDLGEILVRGFAIGNWIGLLVGRLVAYHWYENKDLPPCLVDIPRAGAHNVAVNLRLLGTLFLGHLTTDLAQGMIPALLPFFIADRGLSYAAAGGLVLAATVASSIVQPVFGYFADRRPSPWLVPAGVAIAGVGVALAGVAPTYPLIAAAVAFHGLGVAAFHPEGARAAAFASGEKRATGMSFFSTGGNLGMATGPLVITPLVLALGLRATLAPLLPILLVAAFLSTQLGRLSALRPHGHGTAAAAADADRWGPFGRLAVVVMSRSVVYTGLSSFLPLFFAGVLGRTKAEGATALSILLGTGVVGTLAGGRLADRFGRRGVILVSMIALAPLLYALASARDPRVATALLVPLSLALYLPFSVLVVMGQEYLPNHVGTASGVTVGLAVTAGGLAAPLLGLVADRWGSLARSSSSRRCLSSPSPSR